MKRFGASHTSFSLADKPSLGAPSKVYEAGRKKLFSLLTEFTYAKVLDVQQIPQPDGSVFYHGKCFLVRSSHKNISEVYFDKNGRIRGQNIHIGPCELVDAPLGKNHSLSHPSPGDILIGSLVPNFKQGKKQSHILKGWSMNAKVVLELLRLVEHGTRKPEIDSKQLLRQNISTIGKPSSFNDDFWMLARVILWGNLKPLVYLHSTQGGKVKSSITEESLSLSKKADEFVYIVSRSLEDDDILSDFSLFFVVEEQVVAPYIPPTDPPSGRRVWPPEPAAAYAAAVDGFNWKQSVIPVAESITPPYVPSSPCYAPSSPIVPTSPKMSDDEI